MFRLFLFSVTLALTLILVILVALAPFFFSPTPREVYIDQIIRLFAQDRVVRRTALASAGGLLVTAFVFFRSKKPAKPNPS